MTRAGTGLAACLLAGTVAAAGGASAAAPLPPPRPAEAPAEPAPGPAPAPAPASLPPPVEPGCLATLRAAGHAVEAAPAPPGPAEGACTIVEPVRIHAISRGQPGGAPISLPEAPLVACAFAATLAPWIRDIVAPVLAQRFGHELAAVRTGPGFACRGRNQQAGAKPSAHGRGLALDIAGFELADRRVLPITLLGAAARAPEAPVLQALRVSACGWFTTVLGPGADAFHAEHLHLDTERHGSSDRYRICQ